MSCNQPMSRALIPLIFSVVLSACGGGGGDSTDTVEVQDDGSVQADGDVNTDAGEGEGVAADPEEGAETADDNGNANEDNDTNEGGADSGIGSESVDDDGESLEGEQDSGNEIDGNSSTTTGNNAPGDLTSAVIVAETDGPAWGIEDKTVYRLGNAFSVTSAGHVMFTGSTTFNYDEDAVLWRGMLARPELALRTGMALSDFPPNVRLETFDRNKMFLAEDGSVTVPAVFGGARTVNAVLLARDTGLQVVFRSDQSIEVDGASYDQNNYSVIRHYGSSVAVLGSAGLMSWNNGRYEYIAPWKSQSLSAPLQPDGCRIMLRSFDEFRSPDPFFVRDDGSVVINGNVFVEPGAEENVAVCPDRNRVIREDNFSSFPERLASSDFQTVGIYRNGAFTRLVSTGDSVPGIDTAVFTEVSVLDVLEDGALLVGATIKEINVFGEDKQSRWIFKEKADPRLVLLDGETVESAVLGETYVMSVGSGNGYGGLNELNVLADGSSQVIDSFGGYGEQDATWLMAGVAHSGQPYTNLSALGASPFRPVVATGYPPPPEYPESAYWSSVGSPHLLSNGDGLFAGGIEDSAPGAANPIAYGLWRYNSNGSIVRALPNEVIVNINEIPRTLSVSFSNMKPVGDAGVMYFDDPAGRTERLIYLPFGVTSDQ